MKSRLMLQIRIIGIEHSRENEALKRNLQEALAKFGKEEFLVLEVKDIDAIIQEDIQGIPALFINDNLIFQKSVPTVDEIVLALRKYYAKTKSTWKIDRILVPVDFSDASLNAFHYARQLAEKFDATIKLFHSIPPINADTLIAVPAEKQPEPEDMRQMAVEKMQTFLKTGTMKPDNAISTLEKIKTELAPGFASDSILKKSKDLSTDLIIMATTGSHNMLQQFFGSVSSAVAKNAGCPVLLIPPNVRYHQFKNILYASNYESADRHTIENLLDFSRYFDGNIHFVHIEKKSSKGVNVADVVFDGTINSVSSRPNIIFDTIQSPTIPNGLNQYAESNEIDLIVMVTRHRNLLESWMHRSKTKQMIRYAERPLLVLHYDAI